MHFDLMYVLNMGEGRKFTPRFPEAPSIVLVAEELKQDLEHEPGKVSSVDAAR